MPYKCPIKSRESAKERQRRYRERKKDELRSKNLERYHSTYKDKEGFKESRKEYQKRWRANNQDKIKKYRKENEEQKEKSRIRAMKWQKENHGRAIANSSLRKKRVRRAMPPWADRKKISKFYEECKKISDLTGEKYHVDHIIPLVNDRVCGLHVPSNLRIIRAQDNLAKGNTF